jgi:tetratricopeptide (TPR) repeat protein
MLRDWWEPLYYLGCALGRLSDYSKAEESFTGALALAPDERRIYTQRGHARFKAGKFDGALADYLEAQRRGALQESECLPLAALHLHRGEYAKAEQLLRLLVQQHVVAAYIPFGCALEKQCKWLEAAEVYQQATRVPEIAAEACGRLGIVYMALQRYADASTWLEQALKRKNDSDTVLFYYGWTCYQLRQFERGIRNWTLLMRRYPRLQRLGVLIQKAKYMWGCDLAHVCALRA